MERQISSVRATAYWCWVRLTPTTRRADATHIGGLLEELLAVRCSLEMSAEGLLPAE